MEDGNMGNGMITSSYNGYEEGASLKKLVRPMVYGCYLGVMRDNFIRHSFSIGLPNAIRNIKCELCSNILVGTLTKDTWVYEYDTGVFNKTCATLLLEGPLDTVKSHIVGIQSLIGLHTFTGMPLEMLFGYALEDYAIGRRTIGRRTLDYLIAPDLDTLWEGVLVYILRTFHGGLLFHLNCDSNWICTSPKNDVATVNLRNMLQEVLEELMEREHDCGESLPIKYMAI